MNLLRKIAVALVLAVGLALADDFMGLPIEDGASKDERPLPTWVFGGGGSLAYYLKTFDGTVNVDAEYRFGRHHSLALYGNLPIVADFVE